VHLDFGIDRAPSQNGYPSISVRAGEEGVREVRRILADALDRERPPNGTSAAPEALLSDDAGGTSFSMRRALYD
jgi:hypothetical protein